MSHDSEEFRVFSLRALDLMIESGKHVMKLFYPNVTMGYGK